MPRTVTRKFCERAKKLPTLCPHFHLSMQSGCDATLKRMNRRYDTARYYESVELLREYFDDPAITTDLITGFPEETEEEFGETLAFIEKCGFAAMHIFPYSVRPGTPAADLPGRVPAPVIERRAAALGELCDRLHRAFCRSHDGRTASALWESTRRDGRMFGYSENYIKVRAPFDRSRVNTISPVVLRASDDGAAMDATFLA